MKIPAWGLTNRSKNACWVVADTLENPGAPGSGRNMGNLVQTIAHEVGHIVIEYGHPDQKDDPGPAPLLGTDHKQRLMHSGDGLGSGTVGNAVWQAARGTRLVKGEWDAAEKWMKKVIDGEGDQ